ncbi:MAG: hypothetical protein ACXVRK_12300 [Gaiellaceae bacterium]
MRRGASALEPGVQRLDSKLKGEGAEFLVLGLLFVEGIPATKAYTRHPGYDLLAFNAEAISCRIQVKSRWATDYDKSFPLKNLDTDFVMLAAPNRGYRGYQRRRVRPDDDGRRPPTVCDFPLGVAQVALRDSGAWGNKVYLCHIPDLEQYVDNWDLIRDHLRLA